jgi:hypothetical protein
MRPILTLIADLADAIALGDAPATFTATAALAGRIGLEAAVAVAEALAQEARPLTAVLAARPAPGGNARFRQ